ncbi:actin cytoskeleton and mitosis protein [Paecilomyces lecythidis]
MGGPANAFASLLSGQKGRGGSANVQGRGGSQNRAGPYQSKSSNAVRETKTRGRGRGAGATTKPGRGRGNAATGSGDGRASQGTNETTPGNTLFAQLKQGKPSVFGQPSGPPLQSNASPFAGIAKGPGAFGTPSNVDGVVGSSSIDRTRDPRHRPATKSKTDGKPGSIPVEDATVMNSYHERYERLKHDRAKQRERAIKEGQMADPNQPTSLNQAITPVGTCTSMCPEFERVERIVQKMVDKSEKFLHPATNSLQNMEMRMLKRFRRSAAGYDEQLPSDIRTPKTLLQTTNYLIRHILGGNEPLGVIHKFVWDRTRSIRNDFSVQQLTQEDHVRMAVTCLERIARFHIASLHLLSSPDNQEPFDHHQEREQLNNTMLSLMYYYDDNRGRVHFPNEDEFRAYYIIFSIHDQRPDLEARVQRWPAELRQSPRVQLALELFAAATNTWEYQGTLDAKRPNAIAQGFYARFFNLMDSPSVPYLMACVAEIYLNHIRQTAIRSIWKAYCRQPQSQQHKNEEWTIGELTKALHFDDDDQTRQFCEDQDLEFAENADGEEYLNWGNRPVDSVEFQPSSAHAFSENLVESKRAGRTLVAIVLGLNVSQAAKHGMIDRALLRPRAESQAPSYTTSMQEDNDLFVSADENEEELPTVQPGEPTAEESSSALSSASASSFSNPFGAPSQNIFSQEPQKQTPSLFSTGGKQESPPIFGGSQAQAPTAMSAASSSFAAAPPSAPFNPFSAQVNKASSPFESSISATANQQPSAFPPKSNFSSLFASPKDNNATTNPFQAKSPEPTNNIFTNSNFKFPSTTTSAAAPLIPPFQAPSVPASTDASSSVKTTGETSASSQKPLFNFSAPKPTFSASAPGEQPSPFSQTQGPPRGPENSISNGSLFDRASPSSGPNLFSLPSASSGHPSSVFSKSTGDIATSARFKPLFTTSAPETVAPTTQLPVEPNQATAEKTAEAVHDEPAAPLSQDPDQRRDDSVVTEPAPKQEAKPQSTSALATEPPLSTEILAPTTSDEVFAEHDPPWFEEKERRRLAWVQALKETANKRRQESSASRKRALPEEEQETEPETSGSISKAEKAVQAQKEPSRPPKKQSLALASIAPLPTLPILEQVRSMTERKPEPKPEPKASTSSHVDEDELLLSAARIAAESLKNGPSLLESFHPGPDPFRASQSFSRSLSSSRSASRGQSPLQSHINGYEVALAPDSALGLGRTMSRTEQRIRLTGGKGLAFKPLNFNSDKKIQGKRKKED